MKKLFVFALCLILIPSAYSQSKLTAADWQTDLRFLQETVHKDYPFLFKKITAKKFDDDVEKLYKAMPSIQQHERLAGVARIVASFKYGHTDISWRESSVKYHVAPVIFYWFSDGIYVEGVNKNNASIIGARLVKVEGKPVKEVLEAIKPLVPAENDQYFKAYGLDFLVIPEALHAQGISRTLKKSITYTFEKDGKSFEQEIVALDAFRLPRTYGFVKPGDEWLSVRDQSNLPYYLKNIDKIYYYEYLPASKTVYVRHSQIQDEPGEAIPDFYKKVFEFIDNNDVERLVLDIRLNSGGNNYKNKPIVTGIIENKKINKPGKLFVIIGRRTFSVCQNLVNELSNYTNALFVGEPTAENINFYGDNRRIELPKSKTPVYLSFAWWQDKPEWENEPWLAPQVAVDMSFDEYRSNKDPMLEACLSFSDKDPVIDPMARLRDLYQQGKMDQLEPEAKKMITDPKYRYVDFNSRINDAGYRELNRNKIEAAIFIFQLNSRLFPESANVWDSLAEAFWKAKQTDKAIEYYNKAIQLDPNGLTGDNAKNMLKQINAEKKH